MVPFRMGAWEIVLILVVILIVFGAGKLPQVGQAMGKGLRSFRKGQSGEEDEEESPKPKREAIKKTATGKKIDRA
ncbi:twin-arginine translocase TatA/TatE family subunit [Chloroflexota bacterium]